MRPSHLRTPSGVEPLSDARWARIEDRLFDRLDREEEDGRVDAVVAPPPRSRMVAGAAIALAVAAVIVALVSRLTAPSAPMLASHITTEASASHVAIGEASLDVAPESALVVSGDDERGMLVLLDRGASDFEVAPRRHRPPFIVEAGDVHVRVVGTRFRVERAGTSARVSVSHGVVEVTAHGETFRVAAGESWSPEPTTARAAPEPRVAPTIEMEGDAPAEPSIELNDPPAAPRARPIRRRSAPPRTPIARPEPRATEPIDPPAPLAPPAVVAPPPPEPTTQERYEAAAKLEHTNPAAAMQIYRGLAYGSDAWAKNALFAAGRLQADRGARADATRLLQEYVRRFPGGPNAGDARALLDKLR